MMLKIIFFFSISSSSLSWSSPWGFATASLQAQQHRKTYRHPFFHPTPAPTPAPTRQRPSSNNSSSNGNSSSNNNKNNKDASSPRNPDPVPAPRPAPVPAPIPAPVPSPVPAPLPAPVPVPIAPLPTPLPTVQPTKRPTTSRPVSTTQPVTIIVDPPSSSRSPTFRPTDSPRRRRTNSPTEWPTEYSSDFLEEDREIDDREPHNDGSTTTTTMVESLALRSFQMELSSVNEIRSEHENELQSTLEGYLFAHLYEFGFPVVNVTLSLVSSTEEEEDTVLLEYGGSLFIPTGESIQQSSVWIRQTRVLLDRTTLQAVIDANPFLHSNDIVIVNLILLSANDMGHSTTGSSSNSIVDPGAPIDGNPVQIVTIHEESTSFFSSIPSYYIVAAALVVALACFLAGALILWSRFRHWSRLYTTGFSNTDISRRRHPPQEGRRTIVVNRSASKANDNLESNDTLKEGESTGSNDGGGSSGNGDGHESISCFTSTNDDPSTANTAGSLEATSRTATIDNRQHHPSDVV